MKLHVLDGTYELFRAFFAVPKTAGAHGQQVGAVEGIIATTLSLLRQPDVTHVAAAFDTVIESFRNDLFPGYKTGQGLPEELSTQFKPAERALTALGVTVWPMVEFEADDALASAAARYADHVDQVVLLTPDKDLAQCVVGRRVVTFDRRRQIEFDEAGVWAKFGVAPGSIPDYLALVGDNADGIPGIPGWGAKSAATLLARYHSIDEIPDDPADWDVKVRGARRLADALVSRRGEARLYRTLATLRDDVPLPEGLAGLEWKGASRSAYHTLCDDLGLSERLRNRPHRWQA